MAQPDPSGSARLITRLQARAGIQARTGKPTVVAIRGTPRPPRIEVQVVSASGMPQQTLELEFTLPDGTLRAGRTDANGAFLVEQLPAEGECKLEIPDFSAPSPAAPASAPGRVRYEPGLRLAVGSNTVVELPPRVRRGKLTGMHFETNKTFLCPSAMAGIRQLRSMYESHGAMSLLVCGHTDTVGDAGYNRGLSVERAESIAAYLTDQVDAWLASYGPREHSASWGVREDQYMLATLPEGGVPYYAGTVDGISGPMTRAAYERFRADKGLPPGNTGDADTRRALVTDYMALDRTSLPPTATVLTHGCGFAHLAEPTGPGVASEANRRVEMFLFEGEVTPPPQAPCPGEGCAEYQQWVAQSELTVDLDQPAGSVEATVADESSAAPLDGVHVHAAGPTPHDASTTAGAASIPDLVPGHYQVIADLPGYDAAEAEVEVVSGVPAAVALALRQQPPMKIASFEGAPARREQARESDLE